MRILTTAMLFLFAQMAYAQENFKWPNGVRAAIVLTYDDGIGSQLSTAIPQLNKHKIRGAFFLDGNLTEDEIALWHLVSKKDMKWPTTAFTTLVPRTLIKLIPDCVQKIMMLRRWLMK